ncbi:Kynureninase [Galdieria sulphuraria]|uniref:Kynureninase n=1 Tax=Galdieria sulphuraria TaxID=130081 RepID=M2XS36_GALSU|nr:kynureninase [Galdieria sulphuraria]EME26473.1 kynureninase [Galdieria sulphuraria]GJD10001.1 Kynureninase [Galdieria sulphuraria]|eukprot:XP_005702993.1 kynureninase [Galdieria sulphuraria]
MQTANSLSMLFLTLAESLHCSVDDVLLASKLDEQDELSSFREAFHIPCLGEAESTSTMEKQKTKIYLCSNSLGLQPKHTESKLLNHLKTWKNQAVGGHFFGTEPWASIEDIPIPYLAKVVGGLPSEVTCMNSLTVNLHLFLLAFYRPTAKRHKILIEASAFPSDDYAVQSQILLHGYSPEESIIRVAPKEDGFTFSESDVLDEIYNNNETLCLVLLPGVHYLSGQVFPMEKIARTCQELDIFVGFDLAHAVGNVPLHLHDWGVDFACWCSYKYLCGGPGSIGGAFLHHRHANKGIQELPRLVGWWANRRETRFQMKSSLDCTPGVYGFQVSNPSVFSIVPVIASLEVFDRTSMSQIREKSIQLTGYLAFLIEREMPGYIDIITPREPTQRACQLSLRLKQHNLKQVHESLSCRGVVCDTREPDVLRVAPFPLYNTYREILEFVQILSSILWSTQPPS